MIMGDHFFAARVQDWQAGKASPGLKDEILKYLKSLLVYQYQNIALLDPKGRVRFISFGGAITGHLYQNPGTGSDADQEAGIFRSLSARWGPSRAAQHPGAHSTPYGTEEFSVGAVLLQIQSPINFSIPLIQSWPTPSHSGETVLIRREGNEVVILNELRNRKDTPLTLRYSLQESLPAAMAAKGKEGTIEGVITAVCRGGGSRQDSPTHPGISSPRLTLLRSTPPPGTVLYSIMSLNRFHRRGRGKPCLCLE